ncbi:MAG TPA: F0F1 ATP synthase subunit B [Egibacteraceae bacterium]|nr:F0F1 ATP synthase subunit B [Egibacteraceae bacterium]
MLATIQVVVLAAAEEGNPDQWLLPDFAELLWGFVAFALLMAFMSWKVFPKAGATLDERSARIQGQLEEAENQRQQAEQLRRQYEEQLADARNQGNTIVEDARAQAERVRADVLARAEEEAEQIRDRARADIEAERGRIVQDLRGQVATLSVELAGKIVQRELDPSQHRQLVDQYINELSGMN